MILIACDLSLRCPGFCVQGFDEERKRIVVIEKSSINNKTAYKKTHGQILSEIYNELSRLMGKYPEATLVREEALAMIHISAKTIQVLHKVVGITDYLAWVHFRTSFNEINPRTVKRIVAGKDDASKQEVADGLVAWVGRQSWKNDDESDACAVGIAWLIQNGYLPGVRRKRRPRENE